MVGDQYGGGRLVVYPMRGAIHLKNVLMIDYKVTENVDRNNQPLK